jgi:hypothetical protein
VAVEDFADGQQSGDKYFSNFNPSKVSRHQHKHAGFARPESRDL